MASTGKKIEKFGIAVENAVCAGSERNSVSGIRSEF